MTPTIYRHILISTWFHRDIIILSQLKEEKIPNITHTPRGGGLLENFDGEICGVGFSRVWSATVKQHFGVI